MKDAPPCDAGVEMNLVMNPRWLLKFSHRSVMGAKDTRPESSPPQREEPPRMQVGSTPTHKRSRSMDRPPYFSDVREETESSQVTSGSRRDQDIKKEKLVTEGTMMVHRVTQEVVPA